MRRLYCLFRVKPAQMLQISHVSNYRVPSK